jgi:Protein of unknown function (DUF4241)
VNPRSRRSRFGIGVLAALLACSGSACSPTMTEGDAPPLRRDGFERLFEPGREVRVYDGTARLEVRELGTLDLPTGRLVACDAYVQADDPDYEQPFAVTVPPGRYQAAVSLAGQLVAAARLTVRSDPVVRWELALQPGQDPDKLPPNHFYGFGTDAATAAYLDASSMEALHRVASGPESELAKLSEAEPRGPGWDLRDPVSGYNVIAFISGEGDGSYPTWIGWTKDDQPAMFVTDFYVVRTPGP